MKFGETRNDTRDETRNDTRVYSIKSVFVKVIRQREPKIQVRTVFNVNPQRM
jgi:hypothetical protein